MSILLRIREVVRIFRGISVVDCNKDFKKGFKIPKIILKFKRQGVHRGFTMGAVGYSVDSQSAL
jgi:hypothetical protein